MAGVTVGDISQEAIDDFWRQKDQISSRSHQKGLNYALEGYINLFNVEKVDKKLQLQAKMFRSQCKRDKPHLDAITISDNIVDIKMPLKLRFLAQNMRKSITAFLPSLPRVSLR